MKIRQFDRRDLARILKIEQASFAGDAWDARLFEQYHRRCPELFLVAQLGRRIAGYAITCVESSGVELVSLGVDPRDRRMGVAQALLDEMADKLRVQKKRTWWLMVETVNTGAIRFYEQYGFSTVRIVKGYYGRGRDAWRMRLKLR